jgi:hypothetical protein
MPGSAAYGEAGGAAHINRKKLELSICFEKSL